MKRSAQFLSSVLHSIRGSGRRKEAMPGDDGAKVLVPSEQRQLAPGRLVASPRQSACLLGLSFMTSVSAVTSLSLLSCPQVHFFSLFIFFLASGILPSFHSCLPLCPSQQYFSSYYLHEMSLSTSDGGLSVLPSLRVPLITWSPKGLPWCLLLPSAPTEASSKAAWRHHHQSPPPSTHPSVGPHSCSL